MAEVCASTGWAIYITAAQRGIATATGCRGCVLRPAIVRTGEGLLSARSREFAGRL